MSGQTDFTLFQKKLDYQFRQEKYLSIALTHSSYANEGKKDTPCNERQEFLGDAVLSIIVSDYLFRHDSNLPEGELTKIRAALVCEKALCQYAKALGLGEFLLLGKGEELNGGRQRPSILADAFEAALCRACHPQPYVGGFSGLQDDFAGNHPEKPGRAGDL